MVIMHNRLLLAVVNNNKLVTYQLFHSHDFYSIYISPTGLETKLIF